MSKDRSPRQNHGHGLRLICLVAIFAVLLGLAGAGPGLLEAEPWTPDTPPMPFYSFEDSARPVAWQPPAQNLSAVALLEEMPPVWPETSAVAEAEMPMADIVTPIDHKRSWLDCLQMNFIVRGYYLNDQRIQWSGVEATFGAEAALAAKAKQRFGDWDVGIDSEFYLNERFNRNILLDTVERRSYAANFEIETFEISKLALNVGRGDFSATVGKMDTPFGRTYFPLYTNSRLDAPFIPHGGHRLARDGRTAALQAELPGHRCGREPTVARIWTRTLPRRSSRGSALRARWPPSVCRSSTKTASVPSSKKQFNNMVGADAMVRFGQWRLSSEAIYDEYGFRRPNFDPNGITWGRSLYYRDLNYSYGEPITGLGYYVNLDFEAANWTTTLNYGEFYPKYIGNSQHDRTQRRGIIKVAYRNGPAAGGLYRGHGRKRRIHCARGSPPRG